MSTFGAFNYDDALEIKRRVLQSSSPQKPFDGARKMLGQADKYYVRLDQNLAQATNPLTGYTQAEARPVRYVPGQDSLDMEIIGDSSNPPIIVTNRSESFSASLGNVIQVHRVNSEWAPIHASGGGNSSSDTCPCTCAEVGDITVNSFETLSQWTAVFEELIFKVPNGTVTMPGGSKTLTYDQNRNQWILDIGDSLTAKYDDGSTATENSILDGEITLTFNVSTDSEINVCIDATIPTPPTQPVINYPLGYAQGFNYGYENGYLDSENGNPYDDRVIFSGELGTSAGTGEYQQFGTGTWLAPGTGTYGPGTGSGSGTAPWSIFEDGFYYGYIAGYAAGWAAAENTTGTGSGSAIPPDTGPPEEPYSLWEWDNSSQTWTELETSCTSSVYPTRDGLYDGEILISNCSGTGTGTFVPPS